LTEAAAFWVDAAEQLVGVDVRVPKKVRPRPDENCLLRSGGMG